MIKLTQAQADILTQVQLDATKSPAKIAKALSTTERTVRYHIARFEGLGLIKKTAFINIYPLGYRYVSVYFSLGSADSRSVERFLTLLKQTKSVIWIAELGGDFHYGITLLVRAFEEVRDIFDALSVGSSSIFFEKSYAYQLSLTVYPYKYLTSKSINFPQLGFYATNESTSIDKLDHGILACLSQKQMTSGRAIARELGEPHPTVEYRLRRLEKSHVISGYWYMCDPTNLGYQSLKLLIYTKGNNTALSPALHHFAKEAPNVVYIIERIGAWDFELGIDIKNPQEASLITRQIVDMFVDQIKTIKVVPMFKVLKWNPFGIDAPSVTKSK